MPSKNNRKRNMHPELREAAYKGDIFYNNFVTKLCTTHPHWKQPNYLCGFGSTNQHLLDYLKSNELISQFYCGFKLPPNISFRGIVGDYVEAWIWFLVTNYGEEKAKEYIIKQLKRIANEK